MVWLLWRNFSTLSKQLLRTSSFFACSILLKEIRCIPSAVFANIMFFLLRNCWEKVWNFELVKINFCRIFRKFIANNFPLGIADHSVTSIINLGKGGKHSLLFSFQGSIPSFSLGKWENIPIFPMGKRWTEIYTRRGTVGKPQWSGVQLPELLASVSMMGTNWAPAENLWIITALWYLRFEGCPQLGSHYPDRHQSLGQPM